MKAPDKIYLHIRPNKEIGSTWHGNKISDTDIEYVRKDAFIEKACEWIKENITNNPNANSVLVRKGCVTLTMLIEDFKKYMEE